jgi:hypothetical protein
MDERWTKLHRDFVHCHATNFVPLCRLRILYSHSVIVILFIECLWHHEADENSEPTMEVHFVFPNIARAFMPTLVPFVAVSLMAL